MDSKRSVKRRVETSAVAAILAATLAGVSGAGSVLAADPSGDPASAGSPAVGITEGTAGMSPEELGYTQADVEAKEAQEAEFLAGLWSSDSMMPAAASGYLTGWAEYHQKTNSWCLSAVLQSIMKFKIGTTWITPSVYSKQSDIHDEVALSEALALPWLNGELASGGVSFTYVAIDPKPSSTTFTSHIMTDVTSWTFPSYVAVDMAHPDYVWHQSSHGRHASAAVGYGTSGALVRISDPFTSPSYSPYCNLDAWPGYSSTPDLGCVYAAWDMSKYYNAAYAMWW